MNLQPSQRERVVTYSKVVAGARNGMNPSGLLKLSSALLRVWLDVGGECCEIFD